MAEIIANMRIDLILPELNGLFQDITDYWTFEPTYPETVDYLISIGINPNASYDYAERIDSVVGLDFGTDVLHLAGEGITFNPAGAVTGGTVTNVIDVLDQSCLLGLFGIEVSAVSVYQAMHTPTDADDITLFTGMLAGADRFTLSSQADRVNGYAGNDTLLGMGGNDTLLGGAGNDRITGGAGRDLLTGNAGADRFIFTATGQTGTRAATADQITDFRHGIDRIDLGAIDASSVATGNNSFSFIGTAAFGNDNGGQICYAQVNNAGTANDYTLVYLDTDADTGAEAVIRLNGLVTLTASDFVL